MRTVFSLLAAAPLLAIFGVTACSPAEPPPMITVSEAKAIALPTSAAVYFTLVNSGGADRLQSVDSGRAGQASLHETTMDGGIMRMRSLDQGIEIPAHGRVPLSPQGRHVMIQGLPKPLADGSRLRLKLAFERQGVVTIAAPVSGVR